VGIRSLADGVILTGLTAGRMMDLARLQSASQTARKNKIPIYLGSGVTADKISEIKRWVDGIIVGSALRKGGLAGAPLDPKNTREFSRVFSRKTTKKGRK
jgi:predicted TIM-barrel enzyme